MIWVLQAACRSDRSIVRSMTHAELIRFLRKHKLAVQTSIHADGSPQAALVGFAVTDQLEIVFDTVTTSRKYRNLKRDPRCALVIGWNEEITVQIEGVADEPTGDELARLQACYFAVYPDGRDRAKWPTIAYFRIRPKWARYSDFTTMTIVELTELA
jgi:general stress protein 26